MNIKSLLLGSAAVLIAASTAQAADAIIVEPEPVEYVRICDAYGSGFFYIPGTETCMNINGYVRSTYSHSETNANGVDVSGAVFTPGAGFAASPGDHASWTIRGRLNIDVRNETDWGTLRSQLRLQGGDAGAGGDQNVAIDRALISVAGFRLGYSDTYWTTGHGYGAGSPAINDGYYQYDQAIFFDYTWAADGFSVTVGVQDSTGTATDSEAPDYYIGGKYSDSWGNIAATYIHDNNAIDLVTPANVGGGAWKVSAQLNNIGDTGWNFGAWYMADGDYATQYVNTGFATGVAVGAAGVTAANLTDDQWGVQINGALADNLTGYALYTSADAIGSSTTYLGSDQFSVGLVWRPITGLSIQTEYTNTDHDFILATDDHDTDQFQIRITRSW